MGRQIERRTEPLGRKLLELLQRLTELVQLRVRRVGERGSGVKPGSNDPGQKRLEIAELWKSQLIFFDSLRGRNVQCPRGRGGIFHQQRVTHDEIKQAVGSGNAVVALDRVEALRLRQNIELTGNELARAIGVDSRQRLDIIGIFEVKRHSQARIQSSGGKTDLIERAGRLAHVLVMPSLECQVAAIRQWKHAEVAEH